MNYVRLTGPNLQLPWFSTEDEDRSFLRTVWIFLAVLLVLAVVVRIYPLPEKTREEKETPPPELARVILEKKELPPPPKPKPKPKPKEVKPKEKPKPKPKPKKEPKPQVKPPQPTQEQKVQEAKDVATSLVSQFQDDLAEMRDLTVNTTANNNLSRGESQAKQLDRSVITSQSKAASGGINTAKLSRDTGGQALSGRETTKVKSSLADKKKSANKSKTIRTSDGRQLASRSDESIRQIMDRNKGSIDTMYQRALRKNPALEGRFVVKLIIEPNGQISSATIVTSELDDDALEKKLLARIRLINFGTAAVAKKTLNYTFDFFPQ